jgi:hypothetical protein
MNESEFERKLRCRLGQEPHIQTLRSNPLEIHLHLISTYIDNWRDMLKDLGGMYQQQVRIRVENAQPRCIRSLTYGRENG